MVVILIVQGSAPEASNYNGHSNSRVVDKLSTTNTNTTSISFISSSSSASQVDPENAIATTKEEEWVTKKKVELTTKRQIETRVKRQVVLEDGKVVEDSGPIVTTNTTEDTEKEETKQTEHRQVGDDKPPPGDKWVAVPGGGGLVKEVKEKKVHSREETEERLETEDVQHLGDISDDAYLNAIQNQSSEGGDLRLALEKSRGLELQKTSPGGRIVHQSSKSKKVVDTEDSHQLNELQHDGRILTETRKTTEHEETNNFEEPDDGSGAEQEDEEIHKESSHRYAKTKDQELVDYLADGKKVGGEMRYEAETVEVDRKGDPSLLAMENQEWDSLSTRIRKMRRNKLHAPAEPGVAVIGGVTSDRKDALTKKPLDFDQEEETRKVETSKWLENHFGSESRSSKDSIDDDDLPPTGTSTSFINVTMKSTKTKPNKIISPVESSTPKSYLGQTANSSSRVFVSSPELDTSPPSTSYFQGISEWKSDREYQTERQAKTSYTTRMFKDRVQVLPTGPNHTFQPAKPSPSPPFSSNNLSSSSLMSKNYRGSHSNLNGRNSSGPESPSPFQSISHDKYSYNRYYSDRASPSQDRNSSPMDRSSGHRLTPADRSSPYDRSNSPYHTKITHSGKTSSEEEQRISSPRHLRRFNGHIEREDDLYENEEQRSSRRFIEKESMRMEEPAPDYSPQSDQRGTPSPPHITSTPPPDAGKKKVYQRTRFAADIPPVKPKPQTQQSSGKSSIGESFRKFVGKFRSASSERKKEKRKSRGKKGTSSRSPSPHGHTYQQYNVIDNNLPSAAGGKYHSASGGGGESTEAGESNDDSQPVAPPRSSRYHRDSGTQTLDRRERSTQTKEDMERRRSGSPVVTKFYLGEDPFGGSIYGHEKEYDGVTHFRRKTRRGSEGGEDDRFTRNHHITTNGSSTLGRLSKSTSRLVSDRFNSHSTSNNVIDYTDRGGVQTLPRKLHEEHKMKKQVYVTRSNAERSSPQQQWENKRYNTNGSINSSSTINVSIVNKTTPPTSSIGVSQPTVNASTGPAKPARTYRSSLLRSKSFNVHADPGRDFNSVYKSNPQLHRLDEAPPPLKSPGIVTSISRSTKDISEAIEEEDEFIRKPFNSYEGSFSKSTNHLNGYTNSRITSNDTKKKIFMKGLMDRAPELFKTLHGNEVEENRKGSPEVDDRPGRMFTSTPLRNGGTTTRVVDYSSSFRSSNTSSPLINGNDRVHSPVSGNTSYSTSITHKPSFRNGQEVTNRSVIRRGSNDDYSETVRITSKSDDPLRPSVTNTVKSYTKKVIPAKSGHATETIESRETKTITKSRYRGGGDHDVKYLDNGHKYSSRNGGVVIEVRNNSK